MAKLYFKYGAMGSSKSAQALMTKFNYEEKDRKVWLVMGCAVLIMMSTQISWQLTLFALLRCQ